MFRLVLRTTVTFLALGALFAAPAGAAETLRVGKAVPEAFSFVPLDIGIKKGFFQKYGVEPESIAFAFVVKGAPVKAIAAMAGPPLLLTLVVRKDDTTIKTPADLKGKRVSVSTAGSLTYWLVSETSRQQGWGPNGI